MFYLQVECTTCSSENVTSVNKCNPPQGGKRNRILSKIVVGLTKQAHANDMSMDGNDVIGLIKQVHANAYDRYGIESMEMPF